MTHPTSFSGFPIHIVVLGKPAVIETTNLCVDHCWVNSFNFDDNYILEPSS